LPWVAPRLPIVVAGDRSSELASVATYQGEQQDEQSRRAGRAAGDDEADEVEAGHRQGAPG